LPLTDTALRKAAKDQILRDGGLEFRFFEQGKAGVRFVGRVRGSDKRVAVSLGRYPGLSLQEARKLGEANRRLCEAGTDPRHARQEKAAADQQLVGALLTEYLATLSDNRQRTVDDKRYTLQTALQGMAKWPIKKVTKADVARLLDTYAEKPAARRKLYSYLSHFLGWCLDRDLVETNVCKLIRPPKAAPGRDRVLTDAEIGEVMSLKDVLWGTMLQIVLHTGLRGGEVCMMRVEELDLPRKIWRVPGSTMKQGRFHPAPLADATVALIRGQLERNAEGWGPYVFGVGSNGAKPYNGRSNGLEAVHRLTDTDGWTGHDCRRTAITVMQRLGIPREVRNRVTGHAGPRDGASTYEHHDFEQEAYAAVEKLAAELERVRQAVPISGGG